MSVSNHHVLCLSCLCEMSVTNDCVNKSQLHVGCMGKGASLLGPGENYPNFGTVRLVVMETQQKVAMEDLSSWKHNKHKHWQRKAWSWKHKRHKFYKHVFIILTIKCSAFYTCALLLAWPFVNCPAWVTDRMVYLRSSLIPHSLS